MDLCQNFVNDLFYKSYFLGIDVKKFMHGQINRSFFLGTDIKFFTNN